MDRAQIEVWVKTNLKLMPEQHFSEEDIQHIVMCCDHLAQWDRGEGAGLGHFLTAVWENNFVRACTRADGVNRRALYLYAMFMLNHTSEGEKI